MLRVPKHQTRWPNISAHHRAVTSINHITAVKARIQPQQSLIIAGAAQIKAVPFSGQRNNPPWQSPQDDRLSATSGK
jgi:hypothetical protein